MSFLDHLEELRRRILYALIAVGVCAIAGFILAPKVLWLLTRPVPELVFISPQEALMVQLTVALVTGAVIAAPVVCYQFWRFVRPALKPHEARSFQLAVVFSTLFFLGGVAFAHFIVVPFAMRFLLSWATPRLHPMVSIRSYVNTVGAFLFAAGVIFQLPVVIFFLTKFHIVTPRLLIRGQRVAIVVIAIVAGIVSPPDIFSQVVMAVPMLVLYYLGILGSVIASPKKC